MSCGRAPMGWAAARDSWSRTAAARAEKRRSAIWRCTTPTTSWSIWLPVIRITISFPEFLDQASQDITQTRGAAALRRQPLTEGCRRDAAYAKQARAHVSSDHRSDLRDEDGVVPEDLAALLDESLRGLAVLDVLDDPHVGAVVAALAGILDHSLEGSAPRSHALDRGDLLAKGQDRLDRLSPPQPCLSCPDPPSLSQVLERVDREPHLKRLAAALGRGERLGSARTFGGSARGRQEYR